MLNWHGIIFFPSFVGVKALLHDSCQSFNTSLDTNIMCHFDLHMKSFADQIMLCCWVRCVDTKTWTQTTKTVNILEFRKGKRLTDCSERSQKVKKICLNIVLYKISNWQLNHLLITCRNYKMELQNQTKLCTEAKVHCDLHIFYKTLTIRRNFQLKWTLVVVKQQQLLFFITQILITGGRLLINKGIFSWSSFHKYCAITSQHFCHSAWFVNYCILMCIT